jgi:hypothetical protein
LIDHLTQTGRQRHITLQARGGAQTEIRLNLCHSQFNRAIAKHLQNQGAIEFDVALHEYCCSGHLA